MPYFVPQRQVKAKIDTHYRNISSNTLGSLHSMSKIQITYKTGSERQLTRLREQTMYRQFNIEMDLSGYQYRKAHHISRYIFIHQTFLGGKITEYFHSQKKATHS